MTIKQNLDFQQKFQTNTISPNICVVTGEASGDVQAAHLIHELSSRLGSSVSYWGIGGPILRQQGMESMINAEDLAVVGLIELIENWHIIGKTYKKLLIEIIKRKPLLIIVVDYPGFNLRLAEDATCLGFKVVYYIPPKVWAHGLSRIESLKKHTSLLISILPFEVEFFKQYGLESIFVGNPLFDQINNFLIHQHNIMNQDSAEINTSKKNIFHKNEMVYDKNYPYIIGLLPGSRKPEIERMLPLMIKSFVKLQRDFPNIKAEVPVAHTISLSLIHNVFNKTCQDLGLDPTDLVKKISFLEGKTYEVMYNAHYAWVCSGTATLETAFFKTPLSAVYTLNILTALVAKFSLKVKYVSLVNLCMNKLIIPEFLQLSATVENLTSHAKLMLTDKHQRETMIKEFEILRQMFPQNAAHHAASAIMRVV